MRLALPSRAPEVRLAVATGIVGFAPDPGSGCSVETWSIAFCDASFSAADTTPDLTITRRGSTAVAAAPLRTGRVVPGSVILVTKKQGRWWILKSYCRGSTYFPEPACDLFDCVYGVTRTEDHCERSPAAWEAYLSAFVLLDCCNTYDFDGGNGRFRFEWVSSNRYESASFSCGEETLHWVLTTPSSGYAWLRLLTTGGDPPAVGAVAYRSNVPSWCCTCENQLILDCPVTSCSSRIPERICLLPKSDADCSLCAAPFSWLLDVPNGFSDSTTCECDDNWAGSYVLDFLGSGPIPDIEGSTYCTWSYPGTTTGTFNATGCTAGGGFGNDLRKLLLHLEYFASVPSTTWRLLAQYGTVITPQVVWTATKSYADGDCAGPLALPITGFGGVCDTVPGDPATLTRID